MAMQTDITKGKGEGDKYYFADAHAHLVPEWFSIEEVEKIVNKSKEANVKLIINCAQKQENYEFALETTKFEEIQTSLGYDIVKDNPDKVDKLIDFYEQNQDKICAIGEVGLDFHWVKDNKKRKTQEEDFRKIIQYTIERDLPLVVHSRKAERRTIDLLKEMGTESVLMHCFAGKEEDVREICRLGWYVSVPTSAVYRNSFQRILNAASLDSLMFETDSPFHSLEEGKNNDPSSIPILVKHASNLLGINMKNLARVSTYNVKKFYRI